jgi:5'-nucleotidase
MQDHSKKPLILVTNDDGINSTGIQLLVEVMKEFGDVVVLAPESPQSGMGHAVTVSTTLRLTETHHFNGIPSYQCSGTPVDCVKLAKHHVLKDRKPDLVVSGVNHGTNTSISVVYSGTISAALEAAIDDIPAIAFSLCDFSRKAHMKHVIPYIREITGNVIMKGLPPGVALNVNFPAQSEDQIKGIKICRQAHARWHEKFDQRYDPSGHEYFWLAGDFVNMDKGEDHDVWAVENNYVAVVPLHTDMTAHFLIEKLSRSFNGKGGTVR